MTHIENSTITIVDGQGNSGISQRDSDNEETK
jgi:hypothetical protein